MKIISNLNNSIELKVPLIIAGPCSIESFEVADITAKFLKNIGVEYMRGGIFKPRTSPYSFQGLRDKGIKILEYVKKEYSLKIVSEILDIRNIDKMIDVVDIIQIGSRNMYNYELLKEVGKSEKTILLKRGFCATIDEWLNSAEYIASSGNTDIILCERGIRTYENTTRNTLDLSCIPIIKDKTNLKVIVDPSHGTGIHSIIKPMSVASIGAGADGVIIETHPNPNESLSDSEQTVNFEDFKLIYKDILNIYKYMRNQ